MEIQLSKQSEDLIELGKAPATKSVNSAPKQLEYSKMTNYEKYLYNKNKRQMGVTTEKTAKKEKVVEVKLDTTNPFNKGVSYEAFLKNVTKVFLFTDTV